PLINAEVEDEFDELDPVTLLGDPCQLGLCVTSKEAEQKGFSHTLFERTIYSYPIFKNDLQLPNFMDNWHYQDANYAVSHKRFYVPFECSKYIY
uniref:Uncharacterized protein n=1 Tax=Romanomermis culicivorax TaxID=13658 RepID=A0A915KGB6_ROMCU